MRRELHREVAHAACGPGDQHPAAEQGATVAQRAQRGQASDRQRGGRGEADTFGQNRDAVGGNRRALRPAELVHQCDDAGPGWQAAAVSGWCRHGAADVLARDPAVLVVTERTQLSAIEREGMHRDKQFIGRRAWLRQFPQLDGGETVRGIDQTKHLILP